jgi:glycosyltransferase involved in cell wall biosynthesis
MPPFLKHWKTFESIEGFLLSREESEEFSRIERYGKSSPFLNIDVVYRIYVPFNVLPDQLGLPTAVFYTAELQHLCDPWFTPGGSLEQFIKGCNTKEIIAFTPSQWSAELLKKHGAPVNVVPHGVDPTKLYPDVKERRVIRQSLHIEDSTCVFLNVGAMVKCKNVAGILKAFYSLIVEKGVSDVRLVLKTDSQMYDALKYIETEVNILTNTMQIDTDKWMFDVCPKLTVLDGVLGYGGMRGIYNAADFYISPYRAEGFNLPVLESVACGVPVIVTDGGPAVEFVQRDGGYALFPKTELTTEGPTSFLSTDVEDISEKMFEAVEKRDIMRKNAETSGVKYVTDNYTWHISAVKTLHLLKEAVVH